MFGSRFQKGITLVEIMTTVVIVGIVATMAVPKFQIAFERIRFRSVNRDITSQLRLARSYAVSSKEQHGVHFNAATLSYTLFVDKVNTAAMVFEPGDSVISVDTLPSEFQMLWTDTPTGSIVFRPNGATTATANIVTLAVTPDIVGIHVHNILAATGRIQTNSAFY